MDISVAIFIAELLGLIFGLLAVILLIVRNIWTWPVGIVHICFSLYLFAVQYLYASLLLYLCYLVIHVHGWHHWWRGNAQGDEELLVTTVTGVTLRVLIGLGVLLAAAVGYLLDNWTNAELAYLDGGIYVFSLIAIWLTARKKIECWWFWLGIDIVAAALYGYRELYLYGLLYAVYIIMAVLGLLAWRHALLTRKLACSSP